MTNPWNLTPREFQVMTGALAGHGLLKVPAVELGLSLKTVDTYMSRAKEKMGCVTRFDALLTFDRWARAQA